MFVFCSKVEFSTLLTRDAPEDVDGNRNSDIMSRLTFVFLTSEEFIVPVLSEELKCSYLSSLEAGVLLDSPSDH